MKHKLLALLIICLSVSCKESTYLPIKIRTSWQCDNRALIISAHGDFHKATSAKCDIYSDLNQNKVFDAHDEMIGYTRLLVLQDNELWLSQPIITDSNWLQTSLFVKIYTETDTVIATVPRCSDSKINAGFVSPYK